jgi:hypothetical protein
MQANQTRRDRFLHFLLKNSALKKSEHKGFERLIQNIKVTGKYKLENFDVIIWFVVSV